MMDTAATNMEGSDKVIYVKDLKKSFDGNIVLDGINLEILRGENVAILGRSGSGKSVLIKIISGLLKPDSGIVKVLGQEVDTLNEKELQDLRLKIGFSFQSSALYDSMSVKQNLAFPLIRNKRHLSKAEIKTAVEEVLNEVGLSNVINQMPSELSGGQKKRIGIARTLIMKPEIMLYDEPTAGLDPITSIDINSLIVKVQQQYNASALVITHDLVCAKTTADKVTMLVDKKFLAPAPFEELFNDNKGNHNAQIFYDYNFIHNK